MPINTGRDEKGSFIRWGEQAKYYYDPNDMRSYVRAKERAIRQMKAIYSNGYRG